ncbi:hypothetical protein H310_01979 [Aphanomyces invadans]|uniref:PH domain-containing protein n=1 Tax=Aphanomyces invadans TaxID=157072 RepID=A0A024UMG1_9STRA|nr:hypothetical protein H310_01979 [Aphanomyces invadans]ETW07469.1 hypothetical protein H310_01979 [Aphanomyces invadans]|eukprot:XP_008863562.1 hypothetical protein H310_01979 [Aphanomyces invadans]
MDQTGSCDDSSVFARPAEVVDDIAARVSPKEMASRAWTVPALDDKVFLHASMQLVQQQSETRQRVRNLWYLVQRLRWDGHMDASAMDMLRTDLVQVVKGLSLEKLDGSTAVKSGELLYVHAASRQKVWAVLHHDHGRLDLTTVVDETSPMPSDPFGLSKLSASLAWILDGGHDTPSQGSRVTKPVQVFGATVRSVVVPGSSRLQVELSLPTCAGGSTILVLEAPTEALHAEWIDALTSVARSDLLAMQATVGAAASADEYKAAVAASSPVHVPLMWQRGVVEKAEKQAGLTRRDSKNLSMLQVFKDIARDKYVVDGVAVTSSDDVVHTLMAKIVPFLQQLPHLQPLSPRTSASPVARLARCSEATALSFVERVLRGSARTQSGGDIYDAVALVGGNPSLVTLCPVSHDVLPVMLTVDTTDQTVLHVYLQVCMQFKAMPHQQHHMPVSSPRAGSAFSGRPDVASPLHSPRAEAGDWAVFTGTLSRTFTFGAAADPGHVIVAVDPSPSYADDSN